MHDILYILEYISFDYVLFVEYKLTHNGRLVDRLPNSYEWVDGVQEWFAFAFVSMLEEQLWSYLVSFMLRV